MADHNTRKTTIDRLEEAISRFSLHHENLSKKYTDLAYTVEVILGRLNHLTPTPSPPASLPNPRPHLKLEIPRFDGTDPVRWIFKATQFFDYQGTPNEDRITLASFYMDGSTLSWFQGMFRNGFITSWNALLQTLESRFVQSFYDDPKGTLFKLTQHSSVNAYLTEFERVAN